MSEYDDFLTDFYNQWNLATAYGASSKQDWTNAQIYYNGGDDHAALGSLLLCVDKLVDRLVEVSETYKYPYPRYNITKLFDIIGGRLDDLEVGAGYELTLQKMLGAYIAAPDLDRRSHRYLLDAFSASLYKKPFDLSYHTEWVRRFESWE